jgi:ubiquinone/menaquinone biosynthesis C-methylase UbiE
MLLRIRARRLTRHIVDSTKNCTSLLDLGCGDMILTEFVHHNSEMNVTGIDTIDSNLSHLPVTLYDGNRIPFLDNTFDATMVAYVLHHCSDISAVLREIKRVTNRKILVFEEIYDHRVSRHILQMHDFGNWLLSSKMKIPCNFLRIEQWYDTFADLGLKVEKCTRIYQYPMLNLTHQVLFELTIQ